ncbi:uncharacterized protein LOC128192934 isoform X4 [Crassostrea angulata]|uniref:uncharacterized protein LOC128192934 isoform X4 n=1 Tax=Magallana angulata TaxID=2784310 RepID=UPI0022B12145|nr:uncharacterized protein LOC128192934 isoform X4 [Crassostrea angulata]
MLNITLIFFVSVIFELSQTYENLAVNRKTEQSSISEQSKQSGLAVDNNTDQSVSSCMRTNLEQEVWWRVDLGEIKSIYDIQVFYRNDSDAYDHICQIHGRYVTYYNERTVSGSNLPPGVVNTETIAELCEVQVFGCSTGVFGDDCAEPCPQNCRDDLCKVETGVCLQCVDGWKGEFCNQTTTVFISVPQPIVSQPPSSYTVFIAIVFGVILMFLVVIIVALLYKVRKSKSSKSHVNAAYQGTLPAEESQGNNYATLNLEPTYLGHQYGHLEASNASRSSHPYLSVL